jgi:transposase
MSKGIITTEQRQNQVISRLKNENVFLRLELKKRDEEIDVLKEKLEKALLYIEELQKYVFRGKKKDDDDDNSSSSNDKSSGNKESPSKRNKTSYRRKVPDDESVTNSNEHKISHCPDCHTKLSKLKILEFYEEDVLPLMEWFKVLKKITKIEITTGYCPKCKKKVSAIPIPKQKVSIGNNIKQLVVYQTTVEQLSHSQILDFLESHLRFQISSGEIAHILSEQALKLKPAYDDLIKSLRSGSGVHIDETGYKIAFPDEYSGNYAWSMSSIKKDNNDTVFVLGKNRGKGNAVDLLGKNYFGIGVSDDYPAYMNTFRKDKHALCWAHPHRKFRDLKNSSSLEESKKEVCKLFYDKFASLYSRVIEANQSLNRTRAKKGEREIVKNDLEKKLRNILIVDKSNENEPIKLRTLKKTMLKKIDRYFVCITEADVPTSNNKAERSLRHLVIKRKKSFGSKTPKGAETMSILYSVVMSLWWRSKIHFFRDYDKALT